MVRPTRLWPQRTGCPPRDSLSRSLASRHGGPRALLASTLPIRTPGGSPCGPAFRAACPRPNQLASLPLSLLTRRVGRPAGDWHGPCQTTSGSRCLRADPGADGRNIIMPLEASRMGSAPPAPRQADDPASRLDRPDQLSRCSVHLDVPRERAERSPEYEPSRPVERTDEARLDDHYGAHRYCQRNRVARGSRALAGSIERARFGDASDVVRKGTRHANLM